METSSVYDQRYAGDYREHLSGYEIARWKAVRHFVTHVVKPGEPGKVLDYGAGTGLHVGLWEILFPEAELWFCDISPVAKQKFGEKHPRHADRYLIIGEDSGGLRDESFDVVTSIEVMEHVDDLNAYLRDIHRLLKPGGTFIWTTPCGNRFSIEHVFSLLTGKIERTPEGYRRWKWEDPTHVRRLKSAEADARLRENGFSDVCFRFRSHFFSFVCTYVPTRLFTDTRNKLMTLDYSLFRRLPNGASMVAAARKTAPPS
jgi:ubiquinone/menaquinone biosynthesis C-methylase UbiE